jgi:hypothetical protein
MTVFEGGDVFSTLFFVGDNPDYDPLEPDSPQQLIFELDFVGTWSHPGRAVIMSWSSRPDGVDLRGSLAAPESAVERSRARTLRTHARLS